LFDLLRSASLGLLLTATVGSSYGKAEELRSFGITELQPMSDEEGNSVRGHGLLAIQQGFSLVSGTLYDPATGSTLRERSVQYDQVISKVVDGCCGEPEINSVFAETVRNVSITGELLIIDTIWTMNGSIVSQGYAYAERY
jgi:hypothetical protein